jgi:hypothetical protein
MCHVAEYLRTGSSAAVPAAGAWADPSMDIETFYTTAGGSPAFSRYAKGSSGGTCQSWTPVSSSGTIIQANGSGFDGQCNVSRRVACCM